MASLTKCRPLCGVPSSKRTRNQTGSVYIHGSIFVVTVAVSYASVAKINLNLLKKKRAQSSRQLRSNSAARPLAEVTKKHHQQKGKHTFGQEVLSWHNAGKHTQKAAFAAVCHHSRGREQCGEGLAAAFLPSLEYTRPGH